MRKLSINAMRQESCLIVVDQEPATATFRSSMIMSIAVYATVRQ